MKRSFGGNIVKRKSVARTVMLLLASSGGMAHGQQVAAPDSATPPEETLQTVTVTGVRAAVEAAIGVKLKADNIVEAISAEDIGKLPDTSIAESISRLPGLSSQRSDVRASDFIFRVTDPQFANVLL